MSFQDAWSAYDRGDYERAANFFEGLTSSDFPQAMMGLARTYLAQGDFEAAKDMATRLVDFNPEPTHIALLGEVVGAGGKRSEAEEFLTLATQQAPNDAYIRVVLGEQRIRRGKWDAGADDFIAGLSSSDNRDRAVSHVEGVLADLINALIANKIREADAMKFLNRVDYNVAAKTNAMSSMFGAARRAIAQRQPMQKAPKRTAPATVQEAAVSAPSPPPRGSKPVAMQPNGAVAGTSQTGAGSGSTRSSMELTGGESARSAPRRIPTGNASDLHKLMQRDRNMNEELQKQVPQVGLPGWPSSLTGLDNLPNLQPQLLGFTPEEMTKAQIRLSHGSIASEIAIRRGLNSVLAGALQGTLRPPIPSVLGVAQLEVMCWEGLLTHLGEMPDVYQPEGVRVATPLLALGAFLGTTVTRNERASWTFDHDPGQSEVEMLDSKNFKPFALAKAWLDADNKDDVDLVAPILRLGGAGPTTRWIDLTEGLTDRALQLRLAEMWTHYRWLPREVSLVAVADTVEVVLDAKAVIVFAVDQAFAPAKARGENDLAVQGSGKVTIAYLRRTGEFLVTASRKHAARLVGAVYQRLTQEEVGNTLNFLKLVFRPSSRLVGATGNDGPQWVRFKDGGVGVRFALQSSLGTEQFQLSHMPGHTVPWQLIAQ